MLLARDSSGVGGGISLIVSFSFSLLLVIVLLSVLSLSIRPFKMEGAFDDRH